jgi:hypothetical protein
MAKMASTSLEKWKIHIAYLGAGSRIRCQSSVDEFTLWVSQQPEDLRVENVEALYTYVCVNLHEEKKLKTLTILAKLSHVYFSNFYFINGISLFLAEILLFIQRPS